jgi:hypothetical protein
MEMPGLRLTVPQVARFCGVSLDRCQAVLDALVEARFLCAKADGTYTRLTDGDTAIRRPTTSSLASTTTRSAQRCA